LFYQNVVHELREGPGTCRLGVAPDTRQRSPRLGRECLIDVGKIWTETPDRKWLFQEGRYGSFSKKKKKIRKVMISVREGKKTFL